MPLIKLQFKPGINKETTALGDNQTWFAGNNVRFRSGVAEKIGGWVLDTGSNASTLKQSDGQFWGVARSLFNWTSLLGNKLLGIGTSLKYYIQGSNGGNFNDVTPLRLNYSAIGVSSFAATNGSSTITVTTGSTSSFALVGAFVTFSGATGLGGNITASVLNSEFQIQTIISNTRFTIKSPINANSSDTGNGGAASFTGAISGTTLTVSAVTGTIAIGQYVFGTGVSSGTTIISGSGTSWVVSVSQTVASEAMTSSATAAAFQINPNGFIYQAPQGWGSGAWGGINNSNSTSASFTASISGFTLTVTAVASGTIVVGQTLQGTGVLAGTTIAAFVSGTSGGVGVYTLAQFNNTPQTLTSRSMTSTSSTTWGYSTATSTTATGIQLWSQSNYGENLVMNQRGGPLYYWVLDDNNPSTYFRSQQLSQYNTNMQIGNNGANSAWWQTDAACPTIANFVLVSDQSRFVIAYGTDLQGNGTQNPMLISWSDQESITTWVPSATNQAGNYTLSTGSVIIAAVQMTQQILVFTDTAIYSQQYLGPPAVWGFQIMGNNISILSQNCVIVANNTAFWMGVDKFYFYNGTVQTLPSAMRKYVFENINLSQSAQFFAGLNEGFSEIWWFYCSAASSTIDSYVIYNYAEQSWSYGNTNNTTSVNNVWAPGYVAARTAWAYSPLRGGPISTGYSSSGSNGILIYQEQGVDDGTTTPATAIQSYIQSGDFDIGDGDRYGFAWRMVPDVSFDGSNVANPSCYMTLLPRQNPGAAYTVQVPAPTITSAQTYSNSTPFYGTQQFTQQINIRVRGRQIAMVVGSNTLGTQWQIGVPRLDVRADGRRA